MKHVALVMLLSAITVAVTVSAQGPSGGKSAAERLGYPAGTRLLLVHADDLGVSHSVNVASIKGLESGLVNSASIMVPCPWFSEIADYAKTHPDADLGLHLTLTSEWKNYRWGPVLSTDRVKSLVAPDGYLYPLESTAAAKIDPKEAEAELRAQVERAIAFGIKPTHLDSHMGTLYQNRALFEVYMKVARDYRLPIRLSKDMLPLADYIGAVSKPDEVVIDRTVDITPAVGPDGWAKFYSEAIKAAGPGVTLVTIHLAYDDEEMRAVTVDHPDWGAAWRQRDFDYFTGAEFRRMLEENNIKLVTYRELGKLLPAK